MDKLGNISQIIEIIRGHAKAGISETKHKKNNSTEIQSPIKPRKTSKDELKKNLSQKLKSTSKHPDFASRSKDIFLESVILWEFGEQLANDPLFAEIRSKVRQTIDNNADASKKLEKLIAQLSSK